MSSQKAGESEQEKREDSTADCKGAGGAMRQGVLASVRSWRGQRNEFLPGADTLLSAHTLVLKFSAAELYDNTFVLFEVSVG